MGIFVFILLAGVWAAFLIPSFVDSRRRTPLASTRDYARSTALLASVASVPTHRELLQRQRAMERRRRVLVALGAGAVASLAMSIWQGSVIWLGLAIVFDLALAGYVALLLYLKQQVPTEPAEPDIEAEPAFQPVASSSVRVVAG